jgi:hypothetical protein
MVHEISANDAPTAYHEALWLVRAAGVEETTRNGVARVLPHPALLVLHSPNYRVIGCPIRNANPFFHVMEVVWMFAGQNNVEWLRQFNSRIDTFANGDIMHGAYGNRWFEQWGDQVEHIIETLQKNPSSRQLVLQMWDPMTDNAPHWKDRPCNTHIYFRVRDKKLEMTVCNRSNDVVWGMFGANIVHMTYLQEFVAIASGLKLGNYYVFTNNLHFYTTLYPQGKRIWDNIVEGPNPYPCDTFPILTRYEDPHAFRQQCRDFVAGRFHNIVSPWLLRVAAPMYHAYREKDYVVRRSHIEQIEAADWRVNARAWAVRLHGSKELSHS